MSQHRQREVTRVDVENAGSFCAFLTILLKILWHKHEPIGHCATGMQYAIIYMYMYVRMLHLQYRKR